jgi:hypothetical protein
LERVLLGGIGLLLLRLHLVLLLRLVQDLIGVRLEVLQLVQPVGQLAVHTLVSAYRLPHVLLQRAELLAQTF